MAGKVDIVDDTSSPPVMSMEGAPRGDPPKPPSPPAADEAPDPFDPASLRLSHDFIAEAGVKKVLATVPVRRPPKHDFFRVRPEESYRGLFGLILYGDDKDHYLVTPSMAAELATECASYLVYTCINRQGVVFLWPVRLRGSDGKDNEWWRSAHEAAERAASPPPKSRCRSIHLRGARGP